MSEHRAEMRQSNADLPENLDNETKFLAIDTEIQPVKHESRRPDEEIIAKHETEIDHLIQGQRIADAAKVVIDTINRVASTQTEQFEYVEAFQNVIAKKICSEQLEINFSLFVALAEVSNSILNKDLSLALHKANQDQIDPSMYMLDRLINANGGNEITSHRALDGIKAFLVGLSNITPYDGEEAYNTALSSGYLTNGLDFELRQLRTKEENVLLQMHIEDVLSGANMWTSSDDIEDRIEGTPGGHTDETKFLFSPEILVASDEYSRVTGVNGGEVLRNPTIKLAKGVFGKFYRDKLQGVFFPSEADYRAAEQEKKYYLSLNDPQDEYIYDALRAESEEWLRQYLNPRNSNHLEVLRTVWDFKDHLRQQDRSFYFDIDRLKEMQLHPMVLATIVQLNDEFFDATGARTSREVEYLDQADLKNELAQKEFLISDTDWYMYRFLSAPANRYKIKKKFGVNLDEISIKEQFYFLNYLKNTTVAEAETMQEFTGTHGVEGMRTFLALEQEGESFGDEIVAFGTQEKAGEVFHSYNLLLDEADEVEALIRSEIECEENECEELVAKAHEKIFAQANQYLVSAIRANEEPENIDKISEEIGHARALAAAISVALSEGKIRGVESLVSFKQEVLTGEEANERGLTEQLTSIYERNLKASGYSKESIEELKEKFSGNLTKEHAQLYSWIVGERDVLSFVLVNETPEQNSAFVSGLNVNPDIKASRGGVGLIHEVRAEYDKKGWTLHAVASPKNAEGYTHFGFVATAREESADLPYKLTMAHHPDWNFRSREEGRGQLLAHLSESDVYRSADGNIVAWRTSDPTETPTQLGNGYVITQMFSKKQEGERTYYFVLERFDAHELTSTHSTGPQRQNAA